ncbi:MAG: hypothetical protein AAF456_07195 [Planctomycetota bacterium]
MFNLNWFSVASPVPAFPGEFLITAGVYASGGIEDLLDSDNLDLSARRNNADISSRVWIELKSQSALALPAEFSITVEGSVFARTQVNQTVELWNYDVSDWEAVDTRAANRFSDTTVTIEMAGDPSRFVEPGTRGIEARLSYESINQRQRFTANVDQVFWSIR